MSLLPPNSTKSERNIAKAIDYKGNADALAGFKFNEIGAGDVLNWEYSLGQINIDDFQERVLKGLEFHRIRGTPKSLRSALSWYGFTDVFIEEESPGTHFAEFQIGLNEVPNGFGVDAIVSVAELAAPLRSQLRRIYNSLYDVRRFVLDGSKFGDFLSDDSGVRLCDDEPKLSFGRQNFDIARLPEVALEQYNLQEHFNAAKNIDTYRLDFANLDDAPIDAVNRGSVLVHVRYAWNTESFEIFPGELLRPNIFAKALVVLSESVFGDTNSCLSGGYEKIIEEPFVLSFNLLSENKNTIEKVLVEERFFREKASLLSIACDDFVLTSVRNRNYIVAFDDYDTNVDGAFHRNHTEMVAYPGANIWHDHRHFGVPWNAQNYTKITSN
ncbi:hypothetical protein FACS1894122_10260 [Alphaproteobacteria bacterium]|nr:hypothetical protein FACS1894122_10260 [Alphaproteobacteria bacterium]